MLGRLATWCFKNPWKATGVWIFTAVAIGVVGGIVGVQYEGGMTIPASESKDGFDTMRPTSARRRRAVQAPLSSRRKHRSMILWSKRH